MTNPDSHHVRVPETRCLSCHGRLNGFDTGDPNMPARPSPGDIAVCIKCGAVMKLDDKLRLRGMTDAEMDKLVANREQMEQLAQMVRGVHFLKHMRG